MTRETEVVLLKPHRHDGKDYPTGNRLRLPKITAQWLIVSSIARAETAKSKEAPNEKH